MSLVNSQHTFFTLQGADQRTFKKEVDRLTKESDESLSAPAAKKPRLSQDSPNGSEIGTSIEGVSGTVIKLILEDFLCHKYMEVELNSKINFIVGRNGSGKSAILTALVVALGGTALTTGRGTSLKDFIRNGASSARVTCIVNNSGHLQYKPKEYGNQIMIVRTILQTGGSIVLKSEKGKKISTLMDELRHMTLALGIQVDNPISVLDQNTARHFLNQSKPETKFELFMRATNLEYLHTMYNTINRDIQKISLEIGVKEGQLEENAVEVNEAKRKYDMLLNLDKDRVRKDLLTHEYLWAVARDSEKAVENVVKKLRKAGEEKENLAKMVSNGGDDESLIQEIEALKAEIEALDTQETEKDEEIKSLKQEAQQISLQNRHCLQEKQQVLRIISQEEESIKAYVAEIEAQQQKLLPDYVEQKKRQQEEIQALQKLQAKKNEEHANKQREIETLRNSLSSASETVRNLHMNKRMLQDQCNRTKRELAGMEAEESNLGLFGAHVPEIVRKIDEAFQKGQFRKKPVGPLGAFVKVKDPSWALAVEAAIGGRLQCFAVDNSRDEAVLRNIFKQVVRGRGMPSIACTPFADGVYDTSRTAAMTDRYPTVLDMIEVSNPSAVNALIELCNIETTLLIPTDNECQALLSEERSVPRRCRRAYTVNGDQYFPAPFFRTYAGYAKSARYLQASREDGIREAKETLAELERTVAAQTQQLSESSKQEAQLKKDIEHLYKETRKLMNECNEISDALEQIKDQGAPDYHTVSTLKKDLEEREALVLEKKALLDSLASKLQEFKTQIEKIQMKTKKVSKEIEGIHAQKDPVRKKINKCKEKQRDLQSTLITYKRNLQNATRQEIELTNEKEELLVKQQESKQQAERYETHLASSQSFENGEQFESLSNTVRPALQVEKELSQLKKKLDSVARALGDTEQNINDDYLEKHSIYTNTVNYIKRLKNNVDCLKEALSNRRALYHTQKQLMCAVVSHQFTRVLRYRNHTGSLKFNAERRTLTIESGPMDGTDRAGLGTSSLSGGERSYTTMAFVIALWNVTELPFYFMDEFDVFMDCLNRKTVLTLMLRFAKQKSLYQFGFLTPLDTTAIKSDEGVTIFKLDDPRK